MPQVDLSTLNAPELRRLLDTARARGDSSLSYQILKEMAARRDARDAKGQAAMRRRPGEPRVVALNLGDPLEPEDELLEPEEPEPISEEPAPSKAREARMKPPARTAPEPADDLPPLVLPPQPRGVWDDDPEPPRDAEASPEPPALRFQAQAPAPPRKLRGLGRGLVVGFAAGIAAGSALGWWAADTREIPPPPAASVAAPVLAAAPESAPPPVAVAAVEPAPEVPREEPQADAPPEPAEVAEAAPPEPTEPAASPVSGACAAEPTPADRVICGDTDLQRLQRELRQAYAEALDAHEDRDLLRQRQLAWRDARNTVTDPGRLVRLYEDRIRKLNSATAAAQEQR